MSRFRITVRGVDIELRGYIDGIANVHIFAKEVDDMGLDVIASDATDDYNPFQISEPDYPPTLESSIDVMTGFFEQYGTDVVALIEHLATVHQAQAIVIRGERGRAERAEKELLDRELHHFETEEENARLRATLDKIIVARSNHPEIPECDKHPENGPITCGWKAAIIDLDKVIP